MCYDVDLLILVAWPSIEVEECIRIERRSRIPSDLTDFAPAILLLADFLLLPALLLLPTDLLLPDGLLLVDFADFLTLLLFGDFCVLLFFDF